MTEAQGISPLGALGARAARPPHSASITVASVDSAAATEAGGPPALPVRHPDNPRAMPLLPSPAVERAPEGEGVVLPSPAVERAPGGEGVVLPSPAHGRARWTVGPRVGPRGQSSRVGGEGLGGEGSPRVLALVGPTATGKTALAIALAQRLGGEVVNADSRQIFRHMDIGTAKPTPAERAAVSHHLLDLVEPDESFTLADYLDRARAAVADIAARGRLPIVVGGTGLYVRALARGFDVPRVPPNEALRAELETLAAAGGAPALLARLRRGDPAAAGVVDPHNPRRLMRAIEVAEATSRTAVDDAGISAHNDAPRYDVCLIGLTAERALLHERADRRVDLMLAAGFSDEVAALYGRGYDPDLPALSALGYRELGAYVRGLRSLDDAARTTKWATHRFIRRQLTWFRREQDLQWLDITGNDLTARALATIEPWLALDPARLQLLMAGTMRRGGQGEWGA